MIGLSAAVQFALQSYEFKTWLRLQTGMDNINQNYNKMFHDFNLSKH